MVVRFIAVTQKEPSLGKLAEAEIYFDDGPFAGLKLVGFEVWERRTGERNVTFPARQYSVNGERRSFVLLRGISDPNATAGLRDHILKAFEAHLAQAVTR